MRRHRFFNDGRQSESICIPLSWPGEINAMTDPLLPPIHLSAAQPGNAAWYCARTKPKHELLAAVHVRKNLNLEVFHPQLRVERATQRGVMRVIEPLFPCYIFIRCVLEDKLDDIQYTSGVKGLVRFGQRIPHVADSRIEELQECFTADDPMPVESRIAPADEVTIADGVFAGFRAIVLRVMPARRRVQVLMDVLGQPTPVEVDRGSVILERDSLADMAPILAAPVGRKFAVLN